MVVQFGVSEDAPHVRRVGTDHGKPCRDVIDQGRERPQQNREALALVWSADEEGPEMIGPGLRTARGGIDVDAVGDDRVIAPEPAAARPRGRLRNGNTPGELVQDASGSGGVGKEVRHRFGRVGVEGSHHGNVGRQACVPAVDRGYRLMQMNDVEVAFLDRPAGAEDALGKDRNVRDRAVGVDSEGATDGNQVVGNLAILRVGAVKHLREAVRWIKGSDHADVVAPGDVLLGD